MRNIFSWKIIHKTWWKNKSFKLKSFSKKLKMSMSLCQQSKVLYSLFLLYAQIEAYRNILKLRCRPLLFISFKAFSKNKKRSGTSLPLLFAALFLKEAHISRYILLPDHFIIWLVLLLEMFVNMCIVILCFPYCEVINLEINFLIFIKPFFNVTKKSR